MVRTAPNTKEESRKRLRENDVLYKVDEKSVWAEDTCWFNETSKNNQHMYMGKQTMKLLKLISNDYNISLPELYSKYGGRQLYRCCHENCCKTIYGDLFCEKHRKLYADQGYGAGAAEYNKRVGSPY